MQTILHSQIKKRCFINAPWYDLKDKYLDLFLRHSLQPEIGLEGLCLYNEKQTAFADLAAILKKHGLECTLHAPFFDLAPGSLDPYILQATRDKLNAAFSLIPIFKPRSIVCHLQFEENKHGYVFDQWFERACATWKPLVRSAAEYNTQVMFENTYEQSPSVHTAMLKELDTSMAGFCLDVGHLLAFARTPWQNWLPAMSPWLGQLHLHDNSGDRDAHRAPGCGNFNFREFFSFLRQSGLHPLITLEPHSEADLWQALSYLEDNQLLTGI
ncbi:MAG: sugar phosphate isomerase/epimerase [Desulfocapsaceae bacterium]|nr:sugar phosphate isomerase/epimerase [Desulfocapsaceae bacterium]